MRHALSLAENALASGEFPVGCVFVFENRVVARGSRLGSSGAGMNEIDHAEIVALREFYRLPSGRDPKKFSVYYGNIYKNTKSSYRLINRCCSYRYCSGIGNTDKHYGYFSAAETCIFAKCCACNNGSKYYHHNYSPPCRYSSH